jgi:hypothetical protein
MFHFSDNAHYPWNVAQGALCCQHVHTLPAGAPTPEVSDYSEGPLTLVARRPHVGGGSPGVAMWENENNRVIAIAGAREPADQIQTIEGWSSPVRVQQIPGLYNANAVAWLLSVRQWLQDNNGFTNKFTWVYGYSWGGAVAPMLAYYLQSQDIVGTAQAVTFGTPRFTDELGARTLEPFLRLRLMAVSDPLPYLVPSFSEAPLMHVAAGARASYQYNQYVHVGYGAVLTADGQMNQGVLPPGVPLPIDTNMATFIRLNMGEGRPHAIWNYASTLNRVHAGPVREVEYRGHNLPAEPAVIPGIETRPEPMPLREVRRVIARNVKAGTAPIRAMDRGATRRTARGRVTYRKVDGVWTVRLDGQPIYNATGKRDAKGYAVAVRGLLAQVLQQPGRVLDRQIVEAF